MLFLPKEVETVITTLQGAGYSPYLVGGCVREMLRGKAPSDYDMTSDALPQEVVEAAPLSFASIKYHREVPMGQTVQVFYAPSGNGWYLLGRREEHAAFECYLEFGSSVTESLQK